MSFSSKYTLKEELGKGAFSIVRKCTHRETNKDFAAKIISKKNLSKRDADKLSREERICLQLDHPNVVRLFEVISESVAQYFIFEL
jgi:calcium/calmodulin-dependent protein kinase (CaM kinase) II